MGSYLGFLSALFLIWVKYISGLEVSESFYPSLSLTNDFFSWCVSTTIAKEHCAWTLRSILWSILTNFTWSTTKNGMDGCKEENN